MKRWIIGIVIVLVIAGIVVGNIISRRNRAPEVQIESAKTGPLVSKVSVPGKIKPNTVVNISAKISAKITAIPVREGDSINIGDPLVVLDQQRIRAQLDQARASMAVTRSAIKSAEVNLQQAQQSYDRAKSLHDQKLMSDEQFEQSTTSLNIQRSQLESAKNELSRSQAFLREIEDDIAQTTIPSPIKGVISQLNAEVGEVVIPGTMNNMGTVIMVLSNLSQMECEVEVDETDVVQIALGQDADVTVDALPDTVLHGKVVEIGRSAITRGLGTQEEKTSFKVVIALNETHKLLLPGMSASADIITHRVEQCVYLPIQAVVQRSKYDVEHPQTEGKGKSKEKSSETDSLARKDREKPVDVVFVVGKDDKVELRRVTSGISSDRDIEVASGLKEGERVVIGSYRILRTLKDKDKVREGSKFSETWNKQE